MIKPGLSLYLIMLFCAVSIYSQQRPNIAVADLDAKGISSMEASVVSDFLREALVNTASFTVLERSNMELLLAEQGFQQTGCTTQECAVQIGKLLNMQRIIVGSLSKLGVRYYVSIRMIDIERGDVTYADSGETDTIEELRMVCVEVAARIADFESTGKKTVTKAPKRKAKKKPKKEKTKNIRKNGLGLFYSGLSLRYVSGKFIPELRYAVSPQEFYSIGGRIYVNTMHPSPLAAVYIGTEYDYISGGTELQDFSGHLFGAFVGMEIFALERLSILLDIGPYVINLSDAEDEYDISVNNMYIIANMGLNFYF